MEKITYSVSQASKDALKSIPKGTKFHGYEYFGICRTFLKVNNNPARPYDATLLRYLRHFGCLYGIKLVDRNKSLYMREE